MNVEEIKAIYMVPDILRKYGVSVERNLILCPFHKEDTPSLRVKSDHCHCYGCGWHGDIFDITMFFENCNFKTALDILGGNKKPSLTAHRKAKAAKKERERLKKEKEERDRQYWEATDELIRLDNNKRDYAPKIYKNLDISKLTDLEFENLIKEASHPLYIEALHKIDYQMFLVDFLY